MKMICAWHKIWTLSGEIIAHAQCSVDETIYIYIPCVPHNNTCTNKKRFTRDETDVFLNNDCQECVRAYLSIHDCLSFLHEIMIGNHRTKTFLHEVMIGNHRNKTTESWSVSTIMARTINMHTDLQISSCWEHISTWNMHE
jgi:hypothetical protein